MPDGGELLGQGADIAYSTIYPYSTTLVADVRRVAGQHYPALPGRFGHLKSRVGTRRPGPSLASGWRVPGGDGRARRPVRLSPPVAGAAASPRPCRGGEASSRPATPSSSPVRS